MIRAYEQNDKFKILQLLDSNTPTYFSPSEKKDFVHYLDNEVEDYFVIEKEGQIIGAAGVNYFPKQKIARLAWGMIHPNHQKKGIGSQLTKHRIQHILKNPSIDLIVVRTSQIVFKFYEKLGFKLHTIKKDYWAEGFDLYQLHLSTKSQLK